MQKYYKIQNRTYELLARGSAKDLPSLIVDMFLFILGITLLLIVIIQWWRDISREGAIQGLHTSIVELGLRWGIALFIISEVFFFVSFFWAFFFLKVY